MKGDAHDAPRSTESAVVHLSVPLVQVVVTGALRWSDGAVAHPEPQRSSEAA